MKTITTDDAPTIDDLQIILQDDRYYNGEKQDERIDLTALPTYGGEKPSDSEGAYSWDPGQLLVATDAGHWAIVPR